MPKQCSQTYAATAHDHRYCQLDAGHDGEHIADGFRWSSQPNTPRERLREAMTEVEEEYADLLAADGPYAHEMAVAALGIALQELREVLDSELVHQANEGAER